MRNSFALATGLTLIASACSSGPAVLQDPPLLVVSSPARSLVQSTTGQLMVTGQVTANAEGTPVKSVTVNNQPATVGADGSFSVAINIQAGAQLIHTVATDEKGDVATDTRSVEAGTLESVATTIPSAINTALSAQVFTKLSAVASTMIAQADLTTMLAPYQPMINTGGSCLGAKGYIDSLTMTGATIKLAPVSGGLSFSAVIQGLDVNGHADFDVACIGGSDTFEVTASTVTITGTLDVTQSASGFSTTLANPNVNIQNLNVSASGLPGDIIDLIDWTGLMTSAVQKAAESFMGPMVNTALGGLAGPHQLAVLGTTIDVQVSPSAVAFSPTSGQIALDMNMQIQGTKGMFTYVQAGAPQMNPGSGMLLGLSDNLANSLLEQITELGMLNLQMATNGGTFDSATISATSPPMISATGSGAMSLILPDMKVVFTQAGNPVASAALNVTLGLQITPSNGGNTIAISLGTPNINIDTTNDIPNQSHFTNDDLANAVQLGLGAQIKAISAFLGAIPLPTIDGISMSNLSVGADQGYVMIQGDVN